MNVEHLTHREYAEELIAINKRLDALLHATGRLSFWDLWFAGVVSETYDNGDLVGADADKDDAVRDAITNYIASAKWFIGDYSHVVDAVHDDARQMLALLGFMHRRCEDCDVLLTPDNVCPTSAEPDTDPVCRICCCDDCCEEYTE